MYYTEATISQRYYWYILRDEIQTQIFKTCQKNKKKNKDMFVFP